MYGYLKIFYIFINIYKDATMLYIYIYIHHPAASGREIGRFQTLLATCGPAQYGEWAASVEAALEAIDSFVAANLDGVVARVRR